MPKLGNKKYDYTEEGKAQYKKDKKRLGYQEGGNASSSGIISAICSSTAGPPS
jgi:hypothetical protein